MCKNNKHTFPGMKHKLITYRSAIKLDCSAAYTLQHFTTTTAATLAHVCWKSYYTAKNIKIPGSMLFAARPTKNKYSSHHLWNTESRLLISSTVSHVKTNTLVCTKLTGTYQQVRKGKQTLNFLSISMKNLQTYLEMASFTSMPTSGVVCHHEANILYGLSVYKIWRV